MNLEIESVEDCDILELIIDDYEAKRKLEKRTDSEDIGKIINQIKGCIEGFKIKNYVDYIGPMKCSECYYEWVAVFPKSSNQLRCPECHKMTDVDLNKGKRK